MAAATNITIRPAHVSDAGAISAVIQAATRAFVLPSVDPQHHMSVLKKFTPDRITDHLKGNYTYYVATQDDRLLGVLGMKNDTHLYHLFVAAEHQHKGVGSMLWGHALNQCKACGHDGPYTVNASLNAVSFYREQGFEATGSPAIKDGIPYQPMQLDG